MILKQEFYNKLPDDKIKINRNKNPIEISEFLTYLKVEVVKSKNHLGYSTGWTLRENEELNLKISGGWISGIEYLDSLQLGVKLSNPYNNYVNPFYLFEILSQQGQSFFINYYKDNIEKIVKESKSKISNLERELQQQKTLHQEIESEIDSLLKPFVTQKQING